MREGTSKAMILLWQVSLLQQAVLMAALIRTLGLEAMSVEPQMGMQLG
jgi:hypothetical protein